MYKGLSSNLCESKFFIDILVSVYISQSILDNESSSIKYRMTYCNQQTCPFWSKWSYSTACSVSCGSGIRTLSSTCMYKGLSSNLCESKFFIDILVSVYTGQSILDSESSSIRYRMTYCNQQTCPSWSKWSYSTACSVSCGSGTRTLSSTCMYKGLSSNLCESKFFIDILVSVYTGQSILDSESSSIRYRMTYCNQQTCPSWSTWSNLTNCSLSCVNEMQTQISTCMYNGLESTLCKGII